MSKKLLAMIEKDLRQIIHSKSSALIILIAPVILMVLVGLALSSTSGLTGVKIGVFAPEKNELNTILNTKLTEKGFEVKDFSSLGDCKQSVTNEMTHICVEIAKREDQSLTQLDTRLTNKVNFYVDYSKVRLVWAIINTIRTVIAQESSKITIELTSKLSEKIETTISQIEDKKTKLDELIQQGEYASEKTSQAEDYLSSWDGELNTASVSASSLTNSVTVIVSDINTINNTLTIFGNNLNSVLPFVPVPQNTNLKSSYDSMNFAVSSSLKSLSTSAEALKKTNNQITLVLNNLQNNKGNAKSTLLQLREQLDQNVKELKQVRTDITKVTEELSWAKTVKAEEIMNPIPVEILPVTGEVKKVGSLSSALTYLDYLLPALLIIMIMFVSTLLASTMVIKERKTQAYFRNLISPTNSVLFFFGTYLLCLILVGLQISLLMIIAKLFFSINLSSLAAIVIILFLLISIFVVLGILIGHSFASEETTIIAAVSAALVFLLFSTLIIPLETMPTIIRGMAKLSPFVIGEVSLRKAMIFSIPSGGVIWEVIKLSIILIIIASLTILIQYFNRKKEI